MRGLDESILSLAFDEDIPLGITAFGENTLRLAGRVFDQVVLHTFFEDETLVRCVRTVKEAAERAGRDPATVRCGRAWRPSAMTCRRRCG